MAGALTNPVVITNITDQDNKFFYPGGDMVFITLVNTEEETAAKSQLPYLKTPDDKLYVVNPDIKLNLYIIFSAYSNAESEAAPPRYERALKLLDQVIFFFQYRNVFTNNQYPELMNAGIEKIIMDPISLTFEQLNHLWATLGSKYLPSVVYKCRMLTFREAAVTPEQPLIKELLTDESVN